MPFSLSPGLASVNPIDYETSVGLKLWEKATAELSKEPFDCETSGLHDFIECLRGRANEFGWTTSVLLIPNDIAIPLGDTKNLLDHYGEIDIQHIRNQAYTFITTQSRAAQDSAQLASCLWNSLSQAGRNKISIHQNEYTINDVPSGELLFKVIIRESYIDTNATTQMIRNRLSSLDTYLPSIGYDITKMNLYVSTLIEALAARGETSTDLISNLFKGYKSATDKKFIAYIEKKEDDYEDGTTPHMTYQTLMSIAKTKYQIMVQNETWNAPSAEEEKILALETKVKTLQTQINKQGHTKNQESTSQTGKQRSTRRRFQKRTAEEMAWTLVPPKPDQQQPITFDGNPWWWCKKHKKWCRHKTEKCREIRIKKQTDTPDKDKSNDDERNAKLVKAMTTAADDED